MTIINYFIRHRRLLVLLSTSWIIQWKKYSSCIQYLKANPLHWMLHPLNVLPRCHVYVSPLGLCTTGFLDFLGHNRIIFWKSQFPFLPLFPGVTPWLLWPRQSHWLPSQTFISWATRLVDVLLNFYFPHPLKSFFCSVCSGFQLFIGSLPLKSSTLQE